MKNIIQNLIKIANYLDTEDMIKESNTITRIAADLAENIDEDMDEDMDDMDDESVKVVEDKDTKMDELISLLEELDLTDSEKIDIIRVIMEDDSDVKEFAYEGPTHEEEDARTDDLFNAADNMPDDMSDFDPDEEEYQAADEAYLADNPDADLDIDSLLGDDPELLEWYRNLDKN